LRWITLVDSALRSSNGTMGLVIMLLIGLLAPLLMPADPHAQGNLVHTRLLPPFSSGELYFQHSSLPQPFFFLLGSDSIGRDVFSRVLLGTRTSMGIALAAAAGAPLIVIVVGMFAGMGTRLTNRILRWTIDVFLSIPSIFLVIALAFFIGHSIVGLLFTLICSGWMRMARIVRGEVIHIREREYIQASRLLGQSRTTIMLQHVLPNCMNVVVTASLLLFSDMLLAEAALGFLGFGVQPPTPSWGNMLGDAVVHLEQSWWLAAAPGIALTILTLSLHSMTDRLESAFRP
jgi:peptide/nickel transport system permease protein